MSPLLRLALLCALGASLLLLPACDDDDLDRLLDRLPGQGDEDVERALTSMQQGSLETALLAALTAEITIVDDEDEMATAAAELAPSTFSPAGCVEPVRAGGTVTFSFNACDGPWGLRDINGVVNLVFTMSLLESTTVSLTATTLQVNNESLGGSLSDGEGERGGVDLTGDMSNDQEGQRSWDLITAGGGFSGDGEAMTRAGSFFVVVDEDNCLVMNGGWNTTIRTDFFPTVFRTFKRCEGTCPADGTMFLGEGEIEDFSGPEDISGDVLTLTFIGTERVAFATTGGRAGTSRLSCELD